MMLSANAIEVHRNASAEPLYDEFLIKPIDLDALLEPPCSTCSASTGSMEDPESPGRRRRRRRAVSLPARDRRPEGPGELGLCARHRRKLDEIALGRPASADAVAPSSRSRGQFDLPASWRNSNAPRGP